MRAFSKACIYTIVHKEDLAHAYRDGGVCEFRESKPWITGYRLWKEAERMPVLLGDATDCSKLLYWGVLTNITMTKGETCYTVDRLRKFNKPHKPQDLRLLKTRKHIAPDFIRPYAICETPYFIPFEFTANDYVAALRQADVADHHRQLLVAHYQAPNRTVTATQLSKAVGYESTTSSANLHYGKLGGLVGERLGWLPKTKVNVLATFEKPGREWHWIMRPEVAKALEQLGWVRMASC